MTHCRIAVPVGAIDGDRPKLAQVSAPSVVRVIERVSKPALLADTVNEPTGTSVNCHAPTDDVVVVRVPSVTVAPAIRSAVFAPAYRTPITVTVPIPPPPPGSPSQTAGPLFGPTGVVAATTSTWTSARSVADVGPPNRKFEAGYDMSRTQKSTRFSIEQFGPRSITISTADLPLSGLVTLTLLPHPK